MSEYDAAMVPAMDKVFEKLRELFSSELLPGVQAAVQELEEKQSDVGKVSSSAVAHPYQLLNRFSKYSYALVASIRRKKGSARNTAMGATTGIIRLPIRYT